MDTYAAVILACLIVVVGVALILALRAKGRKCTMCGTRLPKYAMHCPNCGSQIVSGASSISMPEHLRSPAGFAELVATQGPLVSQRFPLSSQGLTIGRHVDNDIILADEFMVSRQHAVITLEQGQYVLYDRDSTNGTWVNNQRIFRHVLKPGDRIQIWQSQFAFVLPGVSLSMPSPPVVQMPAVQVVGEYFDGYFLESLVGRGGMSEVFKARDPNGKTVAIKILQETNPYLVNKFEQEGNRIGPLLRGHPNIVYVHGFHQTLDGCLYFVMEFVDAPSLRKVIQRPLSETETVAVIGQVCSALAFAHEKGIVHRDVKPENILVSPSGQVKVLDFGIAKLTSASTVTQDKIVGTPEYISPEQARGNPVRPASDVYSLGIVLYEMLTGSVPFRRPNTEDPYKAAMEVVRQHIKDPPDPIRKRNPDVQVSVHTEQVTMRALRKDIKDRYTTAKEMGQDLGCREIVSVTAVPGSSVATSLLILQGPRQGQRIPLANRSLALGRFELGSSNPAISRHHANIIRRGDGYWLQDMSKNGTWVDNQRVYGEIPLRTGAMIVIGENILRMEVKEEY